MVEEAGRVEAVARDERREDRERRSFERYMRRVGRLVPGIAGRVFALRGVPYMGCGFHWGMGRGLGALMVGLNDFENPGVWHGPRAAASRVGLRVGASMLFEQVAAAERLAWPDRVRTTRDLRAARRRRDHG